MMNEHKKRTVLPFMNPKKQRTLF